MDEKEINTTRAVNRKKIAKLQDYQKTFETDHGRRVLYDLIDAHSMMKPTFHSDPLVMANREGERMVVLRILTLLKTDIEGIKKLLEGANDHVSKQRNII